MNPLLVHLMFFATTKKKQQQTFLFETNDEVHLMNRGAFECTNKQ